MARKKKLEIAPLVIETVPIGKLKPWEKNPRTHHAVREIAASIETFGYANPIIAQKGTYRILAGHGRLKALQSGGVKAVPVIVLDIDDEKAAAYTLADNKIPALAGFDFAGVGDILKGLDKDLARITGFTDKELADMGAVMSDVADAAGVGNALRKVTFYAGEDKANRETVANDNSLVVVFEDRAQLKFVRGRIRKLQAGNEKSIGQIVFERFQDTNLPAK